MDKTHTQTRRDDLSLFDLLEVGLGFPVDRGRRPFGGSPELLGQRPADWWIEPTRGLRWDLPGLVVTAQIGVSGCRHAPSTSCSKCRRPDRSSRMKNDSAARLTCEYLAPS